MRVFLRLVKIISALLFTLDNSSANFHPSQRHTATAKGLERVRSDSESLFKNLMDAELADA